MLAGRLRDRIEILERTVSKSALGNAESWDTSRTLWGRMSSISVGSRAIYQQAFNSQVTHRVVFRGRQTFSTQNERFRWRDHDYQIIGPVEDVSGLGRESIILVKRLDDGYPAN